MITNDAMEWAIEDINELKDTSLKQRLAEALDRLEYAQAMGWHDRAAEAIGQIGELV